MDRGYLDFARLYNMHQAGAFFITRAKRGMDARRVYSMPDRPDQRRDLRSDDRAEWLLRPQGLSRSICGVSVSRTRDSGKTLVFLTNNTTLPPLTIAALYKRRWQVELFFKWIKQHLRIKRFWAPARTR